MCMSFLSENSSSIYLVPVETISYIPSRSQASEFAEALKVLPKTKLYKIIRVLVRKLVIHNL